MTPPPNAPPGPSNKSKSNSNSKSARRSSGVARGGKIPLKSGGYLLSGNSGGQRGPAPGTGGRPPSLLRYNLTEVLERGVPEIERIANGDLVHKTRVRVSDIANLLACANCGEQALVVADLENNLFTTVESVESASPRDRLQAFDLAGRYGPGAVKQISMETVRDKVAETLNIIRAHVSPEVFESMKPELRAAWA